MPELFQLYPLAKENFCTIVATLTKIKPYRKQRTYVYADLKLLFDEHPLGSYVIKHMSKKQMQRVYASLEVEKNATLSDP